jgi:hypothetical protein
MTFTVVYVNDDMAPSCFGTFNTHEAALKFADRINADLDNDRDVAGGGAGLVAVCPIQRKRAWKG